MNNMSEPAFPTIKRSQYFDCPTTDKQGMTLRDYFAAKAMQALITSRHTDYENGWYDEGRVSSSAYNLADAMMKERSK